MDLNLVVLSGRLSAEPEVRVFESGARLVRYLVTVRNAPPRRVDVIPVTLWDPTEDQTEAERGQRIWIAGSVQRRFWEEGTGGRRSRLEVIAENVSFRSSGEDDA